MSRTRLLNIKSIKESMNEEIMDTASTSSRTSISNTSATLGDNLDQNEQLNPEQWISNEVRLKYNVQRQQWSTQHVLTDVSFVFNETKLAAHKFILLDGPIQKYFRQRLHKEKGVAVIDIPPSITVDSVEKILSYIYGVPVADLGIEEENVQEFLDAGAYFKMDVQLLPQLLKLKDLNPQGSAAYVSSNTERLFRNDEFWELKNRIILKLCHGVDKERIELAFLDWIHEGKFQRKQYVSKLLELQQLIASQSKINAQGGHENDPNQENVDESDENQTEIEEQEGLTISTSPNFSATPEKRNTSEPSRSENTLSKSTPPATQSSSRVDADNTKNLSRKQYAEKRSSSSVGAAVIDEPRRSVREKVSKRKAVSSSSSSSSSELSSTDESESENEKAPKHQKNLSPKKSGKSEGKGKPENVRNETSNQKRPNQNSTKRNSGRGNKRSKKFTMNGQDELFKDCFRSIRKCLDKRTCNEALLRSWNTLWKNTGVAIENLRSLPTNRNRFFIKDDKDNDGLKLLLESRKAFKSDEPKFKDLTQVLLAIIENFAEPKDYRSRVFTDEVVKYLMEELQNYDNFKNSTTAGEILSYFLSTYEENTWKLILSTSRPDVITLLENSITKHWDLNADRETYFTNQLEFQDLIDLIKSDDSTANLCGLWSVSYYTKTDTNVSLRNQKALEYGRWLIEAKCEKILEDFATNTSKEKKEHSKFAKILLDRVILPAKSKT